MRQVCGITGLICLILTVPSLGDTDVPCDVSARGVFPGGESFSGSFVEDGTGDFSLDWRHSAPGFEFEAMETDPDSATCNINGDINADVIGFGTATVNGVGGFSYTLYMEDNRDAPDNLVVSASIVRTPTRRTEGIAMFDPPRPVFIPAALDVTYGGSGSGWTKLYLDDVSCRYRGNGMSYVLQRCNDPLDSGYTAGDVLYVGSVRLRIQNADIAFDMTSVDAVLGFGDMPAPGSPDFYTFETFDPSGASIYSFSSTVDAGDISITLLPPP